MRKIKELIACAGMLVLLAVTPSGIINAQEQSNNDTMKVLEQEVETIDADKVDTVFNMSDGSSNEIDNAVLAESLEEVYELIPEPIYVDSYEVRYEEEPILLVEPVGATLEGKYKTEAKNNYYAVTFAIPDTNKECYLTGLTAWAVDDICDMIIDHYADGEDFSFESLDIIDAEKLYETSRGDDLMCWAATASNLLYYTGWGKVAGFENEDTIFQEFIDNFINEGFYSSGGIDWFFTGSTGDYSSNTKFLNRYPGSGGYLKGYDAAHLCFYRTVDGDWKNEMPLMLSYLKDGCGIGLSISWKQEAESGHAITLWGMIVDKDYTPDKKEYWDSLIVSDSDNNRPEINADNRRIMINSLNVYKLSPYKEKGDDSFGMYYDLAYLDGYTVLKPYSEDAPMETDETATMELNNTLDLIASCVLFSNNPDSASNEYACFDDEVYLWPIINNRSDIDYEGDLLVNIVIKNEAGEVVNSFEKTEEIILKSSNDYWLECIDAGRLEPGRYTYEFTINPLHTIKEAYYINNTYSAGFTVVESGTDISELSISGSCTGKTKAGNYEITMDYAALKDSEIIKNCDSCKLMVGYIISDVVDYYSEDRVILPEGYGDDPLPESFEVEAEDSRYGIYVLLLIEKDAAKIELYSDVISFPYTGLMAFSTENNIGEESSKLENESKTLNEGEFFAFKIANLSDTENDELTGTYRVVARDYKDDVTVLIDETPITLKKGEESEEILINDIKNTKKISGIYKVTVEVKSTDGVEQYEDSLDLGIYCAPEIPSSVVDTVDDVVDPYDCYISLREAIAYCKDHTGTYVSFDIDDELITLNSEIVIDGDVEIYGDLETEEGHGMICISGDNKSRIFNVIKDGSLILDRVSLKCGKTSVCGGSIYVDGGILETHECRITESSSDERGGAIGISEGKAILSGVYISDNSSGFGGAIFMTKDSEVELLNCLIKNNTSNYGTIYTNYGKLNVINSVIVDNIGSGYNGVNAAIIGSNATNIINSIVINDDEDDLWGKINVYASALRNKPYNIVCDDLTKEYTLNQIFNTSPEDGHIDIFWNPSTFLTFPSLRKSAAEGVYTYVSEGVIYISKDGVNRISTGVKTFFTDSELNTDLTGNNRQPVYGCYTNTYEKLEYCSYDRIPSQVYTGKEVKPEVVIRDGNDILVKDKDYVVEYDEDTTTVGTHSVKVYGIGCYMGLITVDYEVVNVSVKYRAYVQKKGWMSYVKNGAMAGTKDNLRMETIQMKLAGNSKLDGGIKYRAYVQKLGWTFWADTALSDTYAGTKGKSLRVEAIQLKGYGEIANAYDVYYQVYCDKYGWLDWAKNGASAGTSGLSYKLRAFQVKLVAKGGKAPGKTKKPYATKKNP